MSSHLKSIQKLARELGMPAIHEAAGLDAVVPYLELMRVEGAVVLLKLDGERGPTDAGPYTGVVSRGKLGEESFRIDTGSLFDAASYIVVSYARTCWGFTE